MTAEQLGCPPKRLRDLHPSSRFVPNIRNGLVLGVSLQEDVAVTEIVSPRLPVATLTPNGSKARFGVAYVRSICSHAGVGFNETPPDEDVQAIDGSIQFDVGPAYIQVKCTGRFQINGGTSATWPAEDRWWAKWKKLRVPVYFVLVIVDPADQIQWLEHRNNGTFQGAAAFWIRVDQMPITTSIKVPKTQRLTSETLAQWETEVNACFFSQLGRSG